LVEEESDVCEVVAELGFCTFDLFYGLLSTFEVAVDPLLLFCPDFDPISEPVEGVDSCGAAGCSSSGYFLQHPPIPYFCQQSLLILGFNFDSTAFKH
jgi:hypothetical protein